MKDRSQVIILLDTNFLMVPIRFGVDISSEIGRIIEASFILVTTKAVVEELKRLMTQVRPGEEKEIKFALTMSSKITVIDDILGPGEDVDDQLIRLARNGYVVATTDSELRSRLRQIGFPVVYLRQTRHIAVDGFLNY
jgi:rRNA-processing protein FCF1